MPDNAMALTAKLVTAYLGKNPIAAGDLAMLIRTVHASLVSPEPRPAEVPQPAVPVKKSVTAESIICLECGRHQKMLKRHLKAAHDLSVEDYRIKWALPADYPVVAPDYAAQRSKLAIDHGLGHHRPASNADTESARGYRYPASRWSKPSE